MFGQTLRSCRATSRAKITTGLRTSNDNAPSRRRIYRASSCTGHSLAAAVYLVLVWSGVKMTRELVYAVAAAPGLAILWAWTFYRDVPGWAGWVGFLQASILLIPTNTLAPVIMIAAAINFVSRKVHKPPPSELTKLDVTVLGLIAVAYGYDQVIITGAQTP
jgi:hypothetical protein